MYVNSNDFMIDGVQYDGTPGLIELLYLKDPQKYTDKDLKQYKDILIASNAHKAGYSQERGPGSTRSIKYQKIIKNLFPPNYLAGLVGPQSPITYTTRSPTHTISTPVGTLTRSRTAKSRKGTGYMDNDEALYEYYDDVNEIIERLRLLVASTNAGNTSHSNEMQSILEELRERGVIY